MKFLEQRLHLSLAVGLIILMGLFGWMFTLSLEHLMTGHALTRLQHDAENLLSAIQFDQQRLRVDEQRLGSIYHRALSGHYYQIQQADGTLHRSRSLWDTRLPAQAIRSGEKHHFLADGPDQQQLLILTGGYEKSGQRITLLIAEDIGPLLNKMVEYQWGFAAATLVLLLLLMIVQRLVIRQAFSNLHEVQAAIRQLEAGEIEQLPENVAGEIVPLVQEVNRLLRLMGQRMQRSRNAVGNLAHALKGPLNLLTQLSGEKDDATMVAISEQTEHLRRLIDHELKRARLAGAAQPGQHFKPATELPILFTLLQRIHAHKALEFNLLVDDSLIIHRDRDDMLELLGNLLDNAAKWADSTVTCRITQEHDVTVFSIDDDGPGCSENEIERLTQRGTRLDEATPGHGLGLAIVKDIVELYAAELHLGRSQKLGGLHVEIRFGRA